VGRPGRRNAEGAGRQIVTCPGGSFEAGAPKALFDPHFGGDVTKRFDVSKDGRFLIPTVLEQSGAPITVVVNWTAGLNQ
jgi:hypothetical protein